MNTRQIAEEIAERLTPEAHAYWAGAAQEIQDEMICLAQREGLERAVETIEDLALDYEA